jgi:hypothetical protein
MALTHPSVAHEQGRLVQHNQRLEFLGDAVLGVVLTRELYDKFPNVSEGPLTKARAQMINRRTLAEQARQIALQNHDFEPGRGGQPGPQPRFGRWPTPSRPSSARFFWTAVLRRRAPLCFVPFTALSGN